MTAGASPARDAAADGRLPEWAQVSEARLAHIGRVAGLMDGWARSLGLDEAERRRWRAAAWLHDALRDAPPAELRPGVPEALRSLPGKVLHGPAVAARLRAEGVADEELLSAVAWHTLGHPALGPLGRALYLADFLEPGRGFQPLRLATLRARMPAATDEVLRIVLAARLRHLLDTGHPLRRESVDFWNVIAGAP